MIFQIISLTLHANGGHEKETSIMKTKIHKIIVLAAACMAMADASGQNYVKEDTWLDRGGTIKTTTYQYLNGLGRNIPCRMVVMVILLMAQTLKYPILF